MTQVSGGTLWLGEGNSREKNKIKRGWEETNWTEFNKYNKQELTRNKRCKPVKILRGKKDYSRKIPMNSEISSNNHVKIETVCKHSA